MSAAPKWVRVLQAFVTGRTWNRFEAARELSDHCLHSTVATIQAKGVPIARRTEKVAGYLGSQTECCRYWLEPVNYGVAITVLSAKLRPASKSPSATRPPLLP